MILPRGVMGAGFFSLKKGMVNKWNRHINRQYGCVKVSPIDKSSLIMDVPRIHFLGNQKVPVPFFRTRWGTRVYLNMKLMKEEQEVAITA